MVSLDHVNWEFPGGTIEPGETIEAALVREVAEEACARVMRCRYLASQHVGPSGAAEVRLVVAAPGILPGANIRFVEPR